MSRFPFSHPFVSRRGQALAELAIALIVLVVLVVGTSALFDLGMSQVLLRRDVRAKAGEEALGRSTQGWLAAEQLPETRSDAFHRVNRYARLEEAKPALPSRLPAGNYTLAARDIAEAELGIEEARQEKEVLFDDTFARLVYPKGYVRLKESVSFPATSGLWR